MSKDARENELVGAVREGIDAFRSGRRLRTRRVRVHEPPSYSGKRISSIRRNKLHVSQSVFAGYLGVSPSTVRSWEQSQRTPSVSARRLIQIAEREPEVLRELAVDSR